MLQRLPVALVEVKPGNTFENLLNEICHRTYSLNCGKETTRNEYNNIMNSIQL